MAWSIEMKDKTEWFTMIIGEPPSLPIGLNNFSPCTAWTVYQGEEKWQT